MNELLLLMPAFVTGMLLGIIFFAGLWWTVQKGLASAHPAWWFLGSLLLRTAITVGGFYFISAGDWQKLLACLAGFLIMRFIITHFSHPTTPSAQNTESRHAP